MKKRVRIGCIGCGGVGRDYVSAMLAAPRQWDVVYICDDDPAALAEAEKTAPSVRRVTDPDILFADGSLDAVGLFTPAAARADHIRRALRGGLHVLAEMPLAATVDTEWQLLQEIEASDRIVAVNTFNRDAWYHQEMLSFIAEGEIGDLAILRVCHMAPEPTLSEGHEPEGAPFRDCGMRYVDVARRYARSEYAHWHAQGLRLGGHRDPWWVQVHGCFGNGVVFDITHGFVYGQHARDRTQNCYMDIVGSKGIARMHHDFKEVELECHGVTRTIHRSGPYTSRNLDRLCDRFARSVLARRNLGCPAARDAVVASTVAWAMLRDAIRGQPPSIGNPEAMGAILENHASVDPGTGFGLPARRLRTQTFAASPLPSTSLSRAGFVGADALLASSTVGRPC